MSMPKITIRPAEEKDIRAILALYCQLDQALVDLQPEFFCAAPREDAFVRQAVQANDADYLLAEADGAVVGFALVNYAGWTPEFSCVLPHRYACLAHYWGPPSAGRATVGWNIWNSTSLPKTSLPSPCTNRTIL